MFRMRSLLFAASALLLCASFSVLAQTGGSLTARPDRGASPGASYSVSDVDSVSLTGGGLSLSIPLASLPPIAGGQLGATITATYNSKLWDVGRREVRVDGTIGRRLYVVDEPRLSKRGGWRIGGPGYGIELRDAHEDFDYDLPQQQSEANGDADWQLISANPNWFRLYLITPDGAEHELVPGDAATVYISSARSYLIGSISSTPTVLPTHYYTVDGTYLSVLYNSLGSWTVTAPDGTQATLSSEGQRIKDTNNNSILIYGDEEGTHYKDEQTGREIKLTQDEEGNYHVSYKTVGGVEWQHVDVNLDTTTVQGKFYKVNGWNPSVQGENGEQGSPCITDGILDTGVNGPNNPLRMSVVRSIVFPVTEPGVPGRRFSFEYNSDTTESFTANYKEVCGVAPTPLTTASSKGLGELSRMTTPSGAVVDYAYSFDSTHLFQFNLDDITKDMVTSKKVTHDGNVVDTWTYDVSVLGNGGTVTNPDGTSAVESAYLGNPVYSFQSGSANGMGGKVFRSVSGNVLVERKWRPNPEGFLRTAPSGLVALNPVIEAEYTSLIENGVAVRMSAKKYEYDLNGNLTQTKEYDWFDPASVERDSAGVPTHVPDGLLPTRQTDTSYYNTAPDGASLNLYSKRATTGSTLIINAPKQTTVGGSITKYSYDGQTYDVAPTKGNVTEVSSFNDKGDANVGTDWVTTAKTYDSYGNILTTTDANGHTTQFSYNDATHAMPTSVTVDPLNDTGPQTALTTYDFSTGLVTSTTDVNGQTTNIDYTNQLLSAVDPYCRPGIVTGPAVTVDGVSQHRKVITIYEDSLRRVTMETDLRAEGDRLLKSRTTNDQLGRAVFAERSEDGTHYSIFTHTVYEQSGRFTFVSNPTRGGTVTSTDGWTRSAKDTSGRVVEVATFAGAQKPTTTTLCTVTANCTGKVTTQYYAEFVTLTDQAENVQRSKTDALGRLVRMDEPSDSNNTLGDYQSPTQPTVYVYDALGNLTSVRQGGQIQNGVYTGGQTRSFTYSTLSRLSSATNPEVCLQGQTQCVAVPVTYEYDPNGNLTKKTDARGTVTNYSYDALNRVTARSYVGGTAETTPPVAYFYDTQELPTGAPDFDRGLSTGKLVAVTYGGGALGNYIGGFDTAGRVKLSRQVTDTSSSDGVKTYELAYEYDLAGNLTSERYPSGRVVKFEYDAAGRTAGVRNHASGLYYAGAASADTTNRIQYAPSGVASSVKLGNGLWERSLFNSRLQTTQIKLDTPTPDTYVLKLDYAYGVAENGEPNLTKNNGNLRSQSITVPGVTTPFVQAYTYDALNRLQTAEETTDATSNWKQVYAYDQYGNRTLDTGTTYPSSLNTANNPAVNPANNRIASSGYSYDSTGNLLCDTNHPCVQSPSLLTPYYIYDAENRMRSAGGGAISGGASYSYDGAGHRVKKDWGATTTVFVYDASGRLVAEYSNELRQPESTPTSYITQDHLGSTRVVTGQNQEVKGRYDYHPFGEEVTLSRSNYGGTSSIKQGFTGYEKDDETGLDFAKGRYYGSQSGRFTSVDPLISSSKLNNPQSWNRYSYVVNNPLRYVDPTGEYLVLLENEQEGLEQVKKLLGKDLAKYVSTEVVTSGALKGKTIVTISVDLAKYGGKLADLGTLIKSADKHIGIRVADEFQRYKLKSDSYDPKTNTVTMSRRELVTWHTSQTGGGAAIAAVESLSGMDEVVIHPEAGKVDKGLDNEWSELSSDGKPLGFTDAIVFGHEIGHAWGNLMLGQGGSLKMNMDQEKQRNAALKANLKLAVEWENYFRDRDPDLKGRHRTSHGTKN